MDLYDFFLKKKKRSYAPWDTQPHEHHFDKKKNTMRGQLSKLGGGNPGGVPLVYNVGVGEGKGKGQRAVLQSFLRQRNLADVSVDTYEEKTQIKRVEETFFFFFFFDQPIVGCQETLFSFPIPFFLFLFSLPQLR
eukprot:TRINITY_DN21104_c0_g1_i1.p1 TRINITY_DN21104_c0_g1~~TRINITY_DN21104_c0_g1_i1.p1  ORF type:complete len:135 (-),score=5.43 TRINITY_DN21104_c0_g1_i1:199-603(-)